MDIATHQTNRLASNLRLQLKELVSPAKTAADVQSRLQSTHTKRLGAAFLDTVKRYEEMQRVCKAKYRAQIERQYRIMKPEATEEEVDAAAGGNTTSPFLVQQVCSLNSIVG